MTTEIHQMQRPISKTLTSTLKIWFSFPSLSLCHFRSVFCLCIAAIVLFVFLFWLLIFNQIRKGWWWSQLINLVCLNGSTTLRTSLIYQHLHTKSTPFLSIVLVLGLEFFICLIFFFHYNSPSRLISRVTSIFNIDVF